MICGCLRSIIAGLRHLVRDYAPASLPSQRASIPKSRYLPCWATTAEAALVMYWLGDC
jgi:hypothetical protein